ncbi:MAG: hydrogenase maturation protease [Hyphomicrobium sp.]
MLTIIGCGNLNRTDDGAGVEVARRLLAARDGVASSRVQIFDAGTDGMGVMFRARGATKLIIVDACRSGTEPGAIFEVPGSELEGEPPESLNLHDFRWQHALYAGRKIFKNDFPDDVVVYLIEARSIEYGIGLTEPVEKAAKRVAELIDKRIDNELALDADAAPIASASTITLKAGRVYLARAVYDRYFAGLTSVILIRRDDQLMIMPVRHAAAGGFVVKIRNAAGDRLIEAIDFFRAQNRDADEADELTVIWDTDAAALVSAGAFRLHT